MAISSCCFIIPVTRAFFRSREPREPSLDPFDRTWWTFSARLLVSLSLSGIMAQWGFLILCTRRERRGTWAARGDSRVL